MDTGYGRSKDRTQNSVLANEFLTHVGHRLQLWLDSLAVSVDRILLLFHLRIQPLKSSLGRVPQAADWTCK
jgi:hypothetical protein